MSKKSLWLPFVYLPSICTAARPLAQSTFVRTCTQKALADALEKGNAGQISALQCALNYLKYFEKTKMPIVESWSRAGRIQAAHIMGVPVDQIPTTNNHLEGFNSVLKYNHLARYVALLQYMCTFSCT